MSKKKKVFKRPNTTKPKPQKNHIKNHVKLKNRWWFAFMTIPMSQFYSRSKEWQNFSLLIASYYVICECEKAITNMYVSVEWNCRKFSSTEIKSRLSRNNVLSERLLNCLYVWPNNWINIPNNSFQRTLRCCVCCAQYLDLLAKNDSSIWFFVHETKTAFDL